MDSAVAGETRLQDAVRATPPDLLGARFRRLRQGQGLSIRDLAAKAGVSKNSVVRLEQGRGSHVSTVLQLCDALGVHVERLVAAEAGSDDTAVHRLADETWYDHASMHGPAIGGAGSAALDDPSRAPVAVQMLRSRLERGRVLPSILDLTGPSEERSHAGEEFAHVLQGRAVITVGGVEHELAAGESIAFWGAEPHRYDVAPGSDGPARVLSIRVNEREGMA